MLASTHPLICRRISRFGTIFTLLAVLGLGAVARAAATPPADVIPLDLRAPRLACDAQTIVLVWDKPAGSSGIVDFNVYMDGRKLGSAAANQTAFSPAKKYFDAFYAADHDGFQVRILYHNFTVTGLKPGSRHIFTVRSVLTDGRESADSNKVKLKTAPVTPVVLVTDYGAKGDGQTLCTGAIQAAIDACPAGGTVRLPAGVFLSGALFLKSHMTFEIAAGATLLGSTRSEDYPLPRGYRLYAYFKYDRPPSLINALHDKSAQAGEPFTDIRIVGPGIIDGQGWKLASPDSITDEAGNTLPVYAVSNNKKVGTDGLLAKAQCEAGVKDGLNLKNSYGQRRSSLITFRDTRGVYVSGLTVRNPGSHCLMFHDCNDVVLSANLIETFDANNADGIELGNNDGGMVFNNFFNTGDDCMNFAAGAGALAAKQPPQQHTWVFNNYFRRGHGAIVIGSHTGAWIQQVLAEDNVINGTDAGLRCKSALINGGGCRDIVFRDNALRGILKQPFIFTLEYTDNNAAYDYDPAAESAVFRDITVSHVTVEKTEGTDPAIEVKANTAKGIFHERINFSDVAFRETNGAVLDGLKDGTFTNVTFTGLKTKNAWTVSNSPGTRLPEGAVAAAPEKAAATEDKP